MIPIHKYDTFLKKAKIGNFLSTILKHMTLYSVFFFKYEILITLHFHCKKNHNAHMKFFMSLMYKFVFLESFIQM